MTATLVLVPTTPELRVMKPLLSHAVDVRIELCGFGPVAAAARTARLLELFRPAHVLLLGIAGSLTEELPIGTACCFDQVACYGIGAGTGMDHLSADEMNWPHWPGGDAAFDHAITDTIPLSNSDNSHRLLLSCCAAAGSPADVQLRRLKYPNALAEDMEGFAVAVACRLAGIPLKIIRGISNHAGDRQHSRWKITEALQSAATLCHL